VDPALIVSLRRVDHVAAPLLEESTTSQRRQGAAFREMRGDPP
jgi:hypothetical protein